ncbi:hypothetical protein N9164_13460 [Draconibacterium sp.]|nr:hypothetical protein [Draconibacterium sp.]
MKNRFTILFILLIFIFGCQSREKKPQNVIVYTSGLCAPATTDAEWYKSDNKAPLFDGLDVWNYPITTENKEVQKYFNQGLILAYGFNHAEAARSFYYATKLDSTCAMAYWGYAYVLGPNYNAPKIGPENYEKTYNAIQKALELSTTNCTLKEKALINAMAKRYVKEPVNDRSSLDIAYSNALEKVFKAYPQDADIGTLYAESLMDLHPWDLYTHEGVPKEWTPEILDVLEQVFSLDPKHPGANHFYIHAVEASLKPEQGLRSARLYDDGLVPAAGHLVHMPSHIYIRTGDYHKGTLSNIRAVEVDSNYVTACHAQGAYPLAYYPHNYHFMAATATLEGNSEIGIMAAKKVSDYSNKQLMQQPGWGAVQHFYTMPYYINIKFGKWEEILKMENDGISLKYPDGVRHYARGMAFVGLDDITKAKIELTFLEKIASDESLKDIHIFGTNSMHQLLQLATRVLKGEILASEGMYEESMVLLKEAVELEDVLAYQEPPDWFFSVRHHLGAVQIEAEKYQDAIITYEEDLDELPKNGWALHGLKLAYAGLNEEVKVSEISSRLDDVWSTADIALSSSRIK